ncbi:Ku protein [Candidatus Bathyarchaeota archaeon]|nr:Ku protein [Candidatus Bathyarchaeota archaeon]
MAKSSEPRISKRPIWSGRITIGLVNVPVKLFTMIFDKSISFRFLHKQDGQPLKYERVCIKEDKVVPWEDIVKGYEVAKNEFVIFEKEELKAARPESDQRIRIDKFVDFLSVDPIYLDKSYVLTPDKSEDAYSLLLNALYGMGKAGVGRITLRTKEYPVLVHVYRGALLMTTLRYAYEVADPNKLEELKELKEPDKEQLTMAKKIISDLSGDFNIKEYEDTFKEKVEELIDTKLKGETIVVKKPVKEEAKELMVALQETLKQLKKK